MPTSAHFPSAITPTRLQTLNAAIPSGKGMALHEVQSRFWQALAHPSAGQLAQAQAFVENGGWPAAGEWLRSLRPREEAAAGLVMRFVADANKRGQALLRMSQDDKAPPADASMQTLQVHLMRLVEDASPHTKMNSAYVQRAVRRLGEVLALDGHRLGLQRLEDVAVLHEVAKGILRTLEPLLVENLARPVIAAISKAPHHAIGHPALTDKTTCEWLSRVAALDAPQIVTDAIIAGSTSAHLVDGKYEFFYRPNPFQNHRLRAFAEDLFRAKSLVVSGEPLGSEFTMLVQFLPGQLRRAMDADKTPADCKEELQAWGKAQIKELGKFRRSADAIRANGAERGKNFVLEM